MLIAVSIPCIVLGTIVNCACGKKPETARRKKVQQAASHFNEIEITSKAFDHKENTGQAGIAGFAVDDGHSNALNEDAMEGK